MKATDLLRSMGWEWTMRHDPACYRALTVRYWKTLLALSVIAVVGAVSFAAWSMVIDSERNADADEGVNTDFVETLSREQMKKTLDLFAKRKADFEKALAETSKIADPAL